MKYRAAYTPRTLAVFVFGCLASLILLIVLVAKTAAGPEIPPQAQASALAVPAQVYKFQSAIVFHSCHMLTGVIFVDGKGNLHPVDPDMLRKLTLAQALILLAQAPAENEISVETLCRDEKST